MPAHPCAVSAVIALLACSQLACILLHMSLHPLPERSSRHAAIGLLLAFASCATAPTPNFVAGEMIELNDNAGWCWFQDERALVDGCTLIAGTVADDKGPNGAARTGNIELSVFDLATHEVRRVLLHAGLQDDDHNAPALMRLPDGRYLAVYGKHGGDSLMRWRISTAPGDASAWQPEQQLDVGAAYTYQNLFRLRAEGDRIYNFHRGYGYNPNYALSEDGGRSFHYGGRLLAWTPADSEINGAGRPYPRYAGDGEEAIHFITTEDHPRNFDNSIYHGFLRDGQLRDSHGTPVAALSSGRDADAGPTAFTQVFQGTADEVAWTVDLELDGAGLPVAIFSVQHGDGKVKKDSAAGGETLHYYYARFDGAAWRVQFLAHAGTRLYSPEVDYSGLAAIDPDRPEVVYISTNANPRTGVPLISAADGLRHYEIYRGRSDDHGQAWTWTAITADSSEDNIRPNIPARDGGRTALLWLRGSYQNYRSYNTRLVALIQADIVSATPVR